MKKKILIVEDEEDIAEIMDIALSEAGFSLKILGNGKNIEESIKKFSPSLIIMDLSLPGIDGASLTKKIKRNKKTKNIPVIIVSARNALRKTTKSCSADDFLAKPFDLSSLVAIVQKFI